MLRLIFLVTLILFTTYFPSNLNSPQNPKLSPQIQRQRQPINFLTDLEPAPESIAEISTKQIAMLEKTGQIVIMSKELSVPLRAVTPFLVIAPLLEYSGDRENILLTFRTYHTAQNWSDWEVVKIDPDVTGQDNNKLAALIFADKETATFQFKIVLTKNQHIAAPVIKKITLDFISPGNTPTDWTPQLSSLPVEKNDVTESGAAKFPRPAIVSRTGWNCPDGQSNPRATPSFTTVTHLIVHHTATGNAATDWPAVVRSIWEYHIFTNGWSDIGYNYLIDPNGVIYEGRGGGDNVLGAHFSCQNSSTMGISMLGTFTAVTPTAAAQNSLQELLSWKADQRNLNPLGNTFHNGMQVAQANISGHRDGNGLPRSCTTTECPGDSFYPLLPLLRGEVDKLVNPANDFLLTANTPAKVVTKNNTAIFTISSSLITGTVQTIQLSLMHQPVGATIVFSNNVLMTGNQAQLTVDIPAAMPAGTYHFQVIGTGSTKRAVDLSLVVVGAVASVSAASYLPAQAVAPESVVAAFGANLATETAVATDFNLPTKLANVTVKIKDSLGMELAAPLFFVSSGQINYQVPAHLAEGTATVTVLNGDAIVALGELNLVRNAPGIFSANSNGSGVAAAVLQRRQNGVDTFEQVARYDEVQKIYLPNSLLLHSQTEEIFLLLFGTGFRHLPTDGMVSAQIGDVPVDVLYAGKQPNFIGVDQVNLRLPQNLLQRGLQNIQLRFTNQNANVVTIFFQ